MPPQEPQYSDLPQGAKVVGYTDLPAGAKVLSGQPALKGDATSADIIKQKGGGPHPSATSPLSHFLPDLNERVASALLPMGQPMGFLRGVEQNIKDYQAQRNPNEGNWFTRGLGVLGKGVADTASDYWQHPGHLIGDVAVGAMTGATGEPAVRPVQAEVGATEGIPWGSGGQGPLSQRGRMIPPPEPPPAGTSTWQRTIPVRPESSEAALSRGLDPWRAGTRIKPSSTSPTYEPPLPGVNVRPSVERLYEPSSALQRASEPPAPANPSAVQLKPSIGRISEFTAKPVDPAAPSPTMRAPNSTVGTAAGAARDTQLFQQARAELGEGASVSEVARRAQELKTSPIARPVAATPLQ
jgi:hypothetical protein